MRNAQFSARMRTVFAALLTAATITPAWAGYPSLQFDLASDAIFRGLSQNNGLSYSARGDYGFDNRSYIGSRVGNNRSAGDAELDVYAGYSRSLTFRELIPYSVDAGVSANLYTGDRHGPRAQNLDYAEAYAGLSVGPAAVKLYYAPDYYNFGAPGYRINGTLKYPLRRSLLLVGTLAWNDGDGVRRLIAERSSNGRGHPYLDYSASLQQQLPHDFTAYLQAAGTNLDVDGHRLPRIVIGIRKSLDF